MERKRRKSWVWSWLIIWKNTIGLVSLKGWWERFWIQFSQISHQQQLTTKID